MRFFLQALALLMVLAVTATGAAQTTENRTPTLEQRLTLGLRPRLPGDFAFVDAVLDTVNRGELPVKIVDKTFFWSRLKAARRPGRRPIIYFQPALTQIAGQLGIVIQADPPAPAGS